VSKEPAQTSDTYSGIIESVLFQPSTNISDFTAVIRIQDSEDIEHVVLNFQGRRLVDGVEIGKHISVTGTLVLPNEVGYNTFTKYPIIYNPKYVIL
jgi:hypothetical protein